MSLTVVAVIAVAILGAVGLVMRKGPSDAPPVAPRPDAPLMDRAQALEELDFDRARGVLSDADYAQLRDAYSPVVGSDAAEALVAQAKANRAVCSSCGTRPEPGAHFCSGCGKYLRPCAACGATSHEAGARFCAGCGAALD
ncbi:MAG: zinc ribbon domain-containing protein [Gemmatimonadaceae bacterium]